MNRQLNRAAAVTICGVLFNSTITLATTVDAAPASQPVAGDVTGDAGDRGVVPVLPVLKDLTKLSLEDLMNIEITNGPIEKNVSRATVWTRRSVTAGIAAAWALHAPDAWTSGVVIGESTEMGL
ncbi:MAG: hypothetical protein H7144_05930 [Burkholderiales bacterium]|nr:hypothetical protein [Phycisphaerae bacterium]